MCVCECRQSSGTVYISAEERTFKSSLCERGHGRRWVIFKSIQIVTVSTKYTGHCELASNFAVHVRTHIILLFKF